MRLSNILFGHRKSLVGKPKAIGFIIILVAISCANLGCQSPTIPDPNDPNNPAVNQSAVLERDLKEASDSINARVEKNLLSVSQGKEQLKLYAENLLDSVKTFKIDPNTAWKDADVMITAERWQDAAKILRIALEKPADEDRRVNDTLRLAHCEAELGQIKTAISLTKSTFSAPPNWKWPILYATYLEIVPAALQHSKGDQLELANLVKEAIHQHELAWGDIKDKKYVGWLETRQIQIDRAWGFVVNIYLSIDRGDLAKKAIAEANRTSPKYLKV